MPWLERLPSEYIKEHFRLTTQPIEEPPSGGQFLQLLEMLDAGQTLLFSSDYPALGLRRPLRGVQGRPEPSRRIFYENAAELYHLVVASTAPPAGISRGPDSPLPVQRSAGAGIRFLHGMSLPPIRLLPLYTPHLRAPRRRRGRPCYRPWPGSLLLVLARVRGSEPPRSGRPSPAQRGPVASPSRPSPPPRPSHAHYPPADPHA